MIFPAGAKISATFNGISTQARHNLFSFQKSSQRQFAVGYTSLSRCQFEPFPYSLTLKTEKSFLHSPLAATPDSHRPRATSLQAALARTSIQGLVRGGKRLDLVHCTEPSVQPVTLALKAARGPVSEYPHWPGPMQAHHARLLQL